MDSKKIPARLRPLPEVYTALEFERLNNAAGPTQGRSRPRRPHTGSVAILHCIGSRDETTTPTARGVLHVRAQVRAPHQGEDPRGDGLQLLHRHALLRKGYEEFYKRLQTEGVKFIRGKARRCGAARMEADRRPNGAIDPGGQSGRGAGRGQPARQAAASAVDMVVLTPASRRGPTRPR